MVVKEGEGGLVRIGAENEIVLGFWGLRGCKKERHTRQRQTQRVSQFLSSSSWTPAKVRELNSRMGFGA